jgi:hypothetical protein
MNTIYEKSPEEEQYDILLVKYNIDFEVKYKKIEIEFKEKIMREENKNKNNTEDYDVDDVETLCNELYKHEYQSVFFYDETSFEKIDKNNNIPTVVGYLWNLLSGYKPFYDVFSLFKTSKIRENIFSDKDDVIFSGMFCYETFHLLHLCICDFLKTKSISTECLDELKKSFL